MLPERRVMVDAEEVGSMMFYDGGWGWWQMTLAWVGMVAFWGLIIWVVYALITQGTRASRRDTDQVAGRDQAHRILDERLARGEIEPDEYRRLNDVLNSDRPDDRVGSGSR